MSEGKSERRGLLWWIEHENTNAFWSARNPWIVTALAGTAIIVLCMVGMHFWGRASRGGRCDGKYSLLRLSGRTLFLRGEDRASCRGPRRCSPRGVQPPPLGNVNLLVPTLIKMLSLCT